MKRKFRNKWITIYVKNPDKVTKGVSSLTINGKQVPGNVVPLELIEDGHIVTAVLGGK